MYKLVETKLQKVILLIGGLLIFFKLIDVSYYDRYNAILTSIGISVLTIVLLILLRNYHPKFHLRIIGFIKKHKRLLIYLIIFIFIVLLVVLGWMWYLDMKETKAVKAEQEKFHNAEIAYQNCLNKVKSYGSLLDLSAFGRGYIPVEERGNNISDNKYYEEWLRAGKPNYNSETKNDDLAFIKWMIEKYPEFCTEYNTDLINYFIKRTKLPILPSLKGIGI